jgi:hypothetical protein
VGSQRIAGALARRIPVRLGAPDDPRHPCHATSPRISANTMGQSNSGGRFAESAA